MSAAPVLCCPEVLGIDAAGPYLIGGRCRRCGEHFFPRPGGCTRCCSRDLDDYRLARDGLLWSWTLQMFEPKPPYDGGDGGAFRPYGVGYVEMPCGVKVESRLLLDGERPLRIGAPMQLVLEAYRQRDGEPRYTYAFRCREPAT